MKVLVLATVFTVAFAQYQAPRPEDPAPAAFAHSYAHAPSANEAAVNAVNARRQEAVNHIALYHGTSVGTAPYYGVPGTALAGHHTGAHIGAYNSAYGHGVNHVHNARYGLPQSYGYGGHNVAHGHAHTYDHARSHVAGTYHLRQAPGPTPADQPAGPTPADQPAGPTPADQPIGPAHANPSRYPVYHAHGAFHGSYAAAPSFNEVAINKGNAHRQHEVNRIALHYGTGVGTAPYYGVPGTLVKGQHNGAYNRAHGGAYGYGYNAHSGPYRGPHRHTPYGAHPTL